MQLEYIESKKQTGNEKPIKIIFDKKRWQEQRLCTSIDVVCRSIECERINKVRFCILCMLNLTYAHKQEAAAAEGEVGGSANADTRN